MNINWEGRALAKRLAIACVLVVRVLSAFSTMLGLTWLGFMKPNGLPILSARILSYKQMIFTQKVRIKYLYNLLIDFDN